MSGVASFPIADPVHTLWRELTADLLDVFDAHFVCASLSSLVARHTGARTLVALSDSEGEHFDVWLSDETGRMKQLRWARNRSGLLPLIQSEQPQRHDKFSRSASELINSELWLLPREAVLAAPLPYPERQYTTTPAGLLCLFDPPEDSCLNQENLGELATLATIFLDRAYLRQQVVRQEVEFAVVSDISRALSSSLNLQSIYRWLLGTIRRTLNVETLSVGLTDPATGDIVFVDLLMGPLFSKLPPVRVKQGQGIAGWVAQHNEPVIINDAYADRRFYSGVDRQSGFETRSMMCIPLQVEERTIGILQAINRQFGKFGDHDLRLLQAIGGPLAAAIENANLHADVIAEKRRVETILAGMSEGVATVSKGGIITLANDAFASLFSAESAQLIGQDIHNVMRLKKGDIDALLSRLFAAEESVQLATDVSQNGRQGGVYLPVLISGAPVKDDQGEISEVILVFSDLTQVREVERMRDDFFQGIIHELRTPLATILMYSRLLREGKTRQPDKAERFLGVIERESDRLQKMVRQMLDLAKLDAREIQRSPEPVQLNVVFEETLPPLADQAVQKGLLFRQRIEPDLPPVMGSADTYHLILKNLVDNAIKFTPAGAVQVIARRDNGSVLIEVRDDGIGIPKEAMPNLFKRFYRTQTAVERGIAGTGLGLYMVKESLDNYNGLISVESELGKGTTFTVRLPAVQV